MRKNKKPRYPTLKVLGNSQAKFPKSPKQSTVETFAMSLARLRQSYGLAGQLKQPRKPSGRSPARDDHRQQDPIKSADFLPAQRRTSVSVHQRVGRRLIRLEARVGIEPTDEAFAEPCLTTWLPRHPEFLN